MNIKKMTSLFLSVMIMLTVICGGFAVTADAAGTITYSYVITTNEAVNAFEGRIVYPKDSLSVNSIAFNGTKNDRNGKILFNDSNVDTAFDFAGGNTVITVVFNVNGDYSEADIYGEMTDFYSKETIDSGNIPFDYANVIDGEVVSCGHTDIDTPKNSYENSKYSIVYSYKENPLKENNTTYTKSVWSNLTNAESIAEFNMPRIENPYYGNYTVSEASFADSKSITAQLSCQTKKYTVTFNGEEQGEYEYLATAQVTTEGETKDFIVDGNLVASGTAYSFFVTGDTDIVTSEPTGTIGENATLISNALYVSDDPNAQGKAIVKMEMLASATSADFERLGVAFASTSRSADDITAAVKTVPSGTATINKIAVHNSAVDNPNVSGQYQFIYAPYVSVSKISKDKSLYFYAYVVNGNGDVTISGASKVSFSNVLA
ncbi:MAG: hypothetical protein IJ725_06035 [Ruminococcus sp.]|nr:hypothetical protein [Ruminococcus sp.]